MTNTDFSSRAQALRARYDELKQARPQLRARDMAAELGVTEVELVAAGAGGVESTMLSYERPQDVFRELGSLGRVMALTRNDWCVHERKGSYLDVKAEGPVGLVLGPDIDLRVFFKDWASAWDVKQGELRSLQFFDRAGVAVHKVYLQPQSDVQAYEALVAKFRAAEPVWPAISTIEKPVEPETVSDPAALRTDWLAMKDTHEFFPLLKRFKVSRLGALRAAGKDLAQEVPADTLQRVLEGSAAAGTEIMCFVGNHGMIQIHSGPVKNLKAMGDWYNVLDPDFNLHLKTSAIASAWIVNKPTSDGWVTSLELYADNGEIIAQFFGARKPGKPELAAWRDLLVSLAPEPLAA
ncbi:putative hemin transport protein [Kerstersia gyiorum]|uniref:Putative hemin transport protein n=1 Tax=Kerstersia gyiorum TaxID=206506 RepID=A0A4Q7MRS7_9BURK|nr:ChuX/HutX family heme-like substrate-binding protein [Kerstersia gyiorum]KAB0543199.1 hemin-degrading factor [Kerstersia gyiorum]RZS70501.1 putative hemin transport protein [Kerstersia gyiorum]